MGEVTSLMPRAGDAGKRRGGSCGFLFRDPLERLHFLEGIWRVGRGYTLPPLQGHRSLIFTLGMRIPSGLPSQPQPVETHCQVSLC